MIIIIIVFYCYARVATGDVKLLLCEVNVVIVSAVLYGSTLTRRQMDVPAAGVAGSGITSAAVGFERELKFLTQPLANKGRLSSSQQQRL